MHNEAFDLLPLKLEHWDTIQGIPIYTNEKITKHIIDLCSKSKATKNIIKIISRGLSRKKILVGYTDKRKTLFIIKRWRDILNKPKFIPTGMYNQSQQKILVVLDQTVDLFGKSLYFIPSTITHELIHMSANQNPNKFVSTLMDSFFLNFYESFFEGLDIRLSHLNSMDIKKTIYKIFNYTETQNFYNKPSILNLHVMWSDLFKKVISDKEATKLSTEIFFPYFLNIVGDLNLKHISRSEEISYQLKESYKSLNYRIGSGTVGQEIIYPSEIICNSNDLDPISSVVNLIKSIKFR